MAEHLDTSRLDSDVEFSEAPERTLKIPELSARKRLQRVQTERAFLRALWM